MIIATFRHAIKTMRCCFFVAVGDDHNLMKIKGQLTTVTRPNSPIIQQYKAIRNTLEKMQRNLRYLTKKVVTLYFLAGKEIPHWQNARQT